MLQRGWTPLHEAASEGQCETVDTLVMAGATVDVTNDVSCSNYIPRPGSGNIHSIQ